MLNERLVNALRKAGAKVTQDKDRKGRWVATNGERTIDWYTQENFNDKLGEYDGRDYVSFATEHSPHTDIMTDYFCDSYHKTIKECVAVVGDPKAAAKLAKKPKKCKSRKAKRKAAKSTSVKELAEAAGLKPGFVLSNPVSGDCYTIGTKGRPSAWVKSELAKMAGVPEKVLEAAVKVSKSKPKAAKRKAAPKPPVANVGIVTVEGMLKSYQEKFGNEIADRHSGKVYKIGQRGRKPSWLRDALKAALGIKSTVVKAAPKGKRIGKKKVLSSGSYRINGVYHYVGEDAEVEVPGGSIIEKAE